jgi:tRNA (guanosine-2'-O-)-methyltransferase
MTDSGDTIIRAIDRKALAATGEAKLSKWPRTSRRQTRIEQVLRRRQPQLTVILEDVHDRHNVSAVLRSCDAVGVLDVHVVYVHEEPPKKAFARTTSGSAAKWMRIHRYDSLESCFAAVRAQGHRILVTALTENASDLHDVDMTQPTALLFGNENRGASPEAIAQADGALYIPMMGMVESLNISVACAVTLYEAQRQLAEAGRYDQPQLSVAEIETLRDEWLKR